MLFQSLSVAAIFAALPSALALPNVTAKALPADCSSYPLYNEATGNAGPWILNLANSDNADIEGWGDSSVYSVANSPAGPRMRWGYVRLSEIHICICSVALTASDDDCLQQPIRQDCLAVPGFSSPRMD
jgi:hypothetical protein